MATLVLGAVGTALGGTFISSTFLGMTGAAIGGLVGSSLGSMIDAGLMAGNQSQRFEGARLDALRVTSSTEGAVVSRVYGRMRVPGNIIWATDFEERQETTTIRGPRRFGLFGPRSSTSTTEFFYTASFAIGVCEGPITGIGRVWADGKPFDISGEGIRVYNGDEEQEQDPTIVAKMGAERTPAYRGLAYVVFEDLDLEDFGNRIPQFTFEVFRPLADPDTAEGMTKAVTVIPASGEFSYATEIIRKSEDDTVAENATALSSTSDFLVSLDRLKAMAPEVESVSLVVAWFGDDLRAGECRIRPGVEVAEKDTSPQVWSVNGVERSAAYVVSSDGEGRPVFGGTPADFAVVQAIQEMKARGLRVTFYPFILMDIPEGNTLPNPYSDDAASAGQPAFPWRGRITCSPAAGFAGAVDKTATAATQVAALFGSAEPGDFEIEDESVSFTGSASEWSLRRMILHYANLCAAAGGVDAFIIGSEMRGLTQVRSAAGTYPSVQHLRDLAADVRSIVGAGTKVSYAADWSEYFGHQPQDGTGDVYFHLDPLWADPHIDFVGIDNYMPLSDWRDGFEHMDAQDWPVIYDRAYLQANVEGGEGFDWFYATTSARAQQDRTPITDGAAGKPWVFRYKDLRSWWSNQHFNRPGGVESGSPTAWVPESKPFWFTEFGCPAVDRGSNQPNVFFDPKSSESFVPYFSRGWRDDAIQRAYIEATLDYWSTPENNPVSSVYGERMIRVPECAAWTWDARPYPFFPELTDVWTDGANWRLGHWLTGRLGAVSLQALVRHLCVRAGMPPDRIDVSGLWGAVEGYVITAIESPRASIATLARHFGFDSFESEGIVRFKMPGRAPSATITLDDMVVGGNANAEFIELTRGQETELPQAMKWQVARSDEDYDAAMVEARRITVDSTRIAAEAFPFAVPPEEAERRCRRALMETWIGRETAVFRLPPSRLAIDPGDVLRLEHDARQIDIRIVSVADSDSRALDALFQDRAIYDLPTGTAPATSMSRSVVFGGTDVLFLDVPQLFENDVDHQPLVAAFARPWPGAVAVWRSASQENFELIQTFGTRARMGTLVSALGAGPSSRFDMANELVVDIRGGTLQSVTDTALLSGANALAVESAPGVWEIVQGANAELVATGRYRLTRLLRGQRGTEHAIAASVAPGARVVVIDDSLVPMPIPVGDIGQPWNWRIGPASLPFTDDSYVAQSFTPTGVGLRPFSVGHIEQPGLRGRTPGDLTIRWKRRDRSLVADSWEAIDAPLSEASEAYEVDILDGATVKRTLSSSTTSVVYSEAQQIADWGAALGPGATLVVRIAQLSALVGRGAARTVTLNF